MGLLGPFTRVELRESMFTEAETLLLTHGEHLEVSTFRYSTGVAAVRVRNSVGEMVVLPFQGQQVWRASFHGEEPTMRSLFDEPKPVSPSRVWGYLETYGGFVVHCGALAMGVPGEGDDHLVHGELPNAPYQRAWVDIGNFAPENASVTAGGRDDAPRQPICGAVSVGGTYTHSQAFTHHYEATAEALLHESSSAISVDMAVTNRFHKPMPLMAMEHVNFKPVVGGVLKYSARNGREDVQLRQSVPGHVVPSEAHLAFVARCAEDPSLLDTFTPDVLAALDPEVVAYYDYKADAEGYAHTMQVLPSGKAHYIAHKPSQLPKGVRWIVNDGSQAALGMCLPATAYPEGKTIEEARGNVLSLAPGETFKCEVVVGVLEAGQVAYVSSRIDDIMAAN